MNRTSHRPRQKHVLVTGGAGFIGSHLVERLLADGKRVTVIDDLSTGQLKNLEAVQAHEDLAFIESQVSACPTLSDLVADAESIYHLAAAVGVDLVVKEPVRTLETNVKETEELLRAAGRHNVPVLITSTSEVYGKSQKEAFHEDDDLLIGPPTHSRWSYACSKLMDEFLALAYHRDTRLPVTIVRLFNTVGPRQTGRYGMVLPRFLEAARSGDPLRVFGDGSQTRCFSFVSDVVEALVRLQRCAPANGQVVNVGGTEEISILDLARRVLEVTESHSPIEFVPYDLAYAPGFEDMQRRRPCVTKLQTLVGFTASTSLDEIIRRTAESLHGG